MAMGVDALPVMRGCPLNCYCTPVPALVVEMGAGREIS